MRHFPGGYKGYHQSGEADAAKAIREREFAALKNGKGEITNEVFATTDPQFQEACKLAKVEPTKAQASKYRRGFGAAFEAAQRLKRSNAS